ncbi:UBX domain-containing protein 4 [Staphylotrichum tortipilum]|uniref:UBX domain-containing protein 2 n=1 Tax=Staphylotrichum tortipilum TaxID=2831512 RepID=A0AAN6MT40_9PEZI|nr:UBX domain-containing protein 4 [Staphylotrichum longicolle]
MAFFQGTLQEGIATALQQSKSVVCFVTDSGAESQQWEVEFFPEEEIRALLQSQAVSLRLEAGSVEEGFLAQLYPIPKKPTVVIIRNAELKEYIAAGVSKAEFMRRIKASLTAPQPPPAQATTPASSEIPQPEPAPAPTTSTSLPSQADGSSTSSSGQATPPSPSGSRVQEAITEKDVRLAEKKKADEETARRLAEKGKGRADAGDAKKTDAQSRHAEALKKKQREAREERQRILKAIEVDKAARKAQKAEAESERRASVASEHAESARQALAGSLRRPSTSKHSEHCAIQVRLLDGSTIRNRFASDQTLKAVRDWIDETQEGKEPYTFKVLLTPLPSKKIDATEEGKSLHVLELVPSSTLILVRVPRFTAAFTSAAPAGGAVKSNIFQKLIGYILAIITGFLGAISSFFSSILPTNHSPADSEPSSGRTSQSQAVADATRRRGRIAGMDPTSEHRNEQQFYNGNSTNFEPRTDDDSQQ